ncbi:hypothetical protein [Lysinibacter sp. HNR]|uniref:hypothetical protein n=1 Tax=Lysinibacter sp. HNR TaxID=3031408 RepID=UPI0024358079|nr:hypothetical protein [Lysinibacter sp. HNR]WGD37524.1 hypothetical protein FrondiHNR_00955 [Lysinibacter sp. HNR]
MASTVLARTSLKIATATTAGVLLWGLTACTNPVDFIADQVSQKADEAVTGILGENSELQVDTGNGVDLPAAWPSDLPTPPGKITLSVTTKGSPNITTTNVTLDQINAFADAAVVAGYSKSMNVAAGDKSVITLTKETVSVTIATGFSSAVFTFSGV